MLFFFDTYDRAPIAQTYVHFRRFSASVERMERAFNTARDAAQAVANGIYSQGCAVEVIAEEGSWKEWLTVGVSVLGLMANYDHLKANIPMMIDDGIRFSTGVYEHVIPELEDVGSDIIRQSRKAIPGQILLLMNELESAEMLKQSDKSNAQQRLNHIKLRLQWIAKSIPQKDMACLISAIQERDVPGLPKTIEEVRMPIEPSHAMESPKTTTLTFFQRPISIALPTIEQRPSQATAAQRARFRRKTTVIVPGTEDNIRESSQ